MLPASLEETYHERNSRARTPPPRARDQLRLFGAATKHDGDCDDEEEHTIRRVFELTNTAYPYARPRVVTQLQYLAWPDLDVPRDPRGLLALMQDVEEIVEELEELGAAIGRQTESAFEKTKSMVGVVRQNIKARHERARSRAKEIRAAGERWFSSVSEVGAKVRERVSLAKENARALRETVVLKHARREEARRARQERRDVRRERRGERRARRAQPVN